MYASEILLAIRLGPEGWTMEELDERELGNDTVLERIVSGDLQEAAKWM